MRTPGVLGPDQVTDRLAARVRQAAKFVADPAAWSPVINLGTSAFTGARLREAWPTLFPDALAWRDWAATVPAGVRVEWRSASYDGSGEARQEIPARVVVDSIEAAARLLGAEHVARVERVASRWRRLREQFADVEDLPRVLTAVRDWSDRDFAILCDAALYLRRPQPTIMTSRQLPVPGMDTKWLSRRIGWVARLAGTARDDLPVTTRRPGRVHFTYLDTLHLEAGGRRHDVATEGDRDVVAYRPATVVICENRDVVACFPAVPGGIAIEGDGAGPGLIASLPWVRDAPRLCYWGDMDAAGLEILSGFRRAGLVIDSVQMSMSAYERWEHRGVDHDAEGGPIRCHPPRDVLLTEPERALYLALCSPAWKRPRRIEQERVSIEEAWTEVLLGDGTVRGDVRGGDGA